MKVLLVVDLQRQLKDEFWKYEKCIDYIKSHRDEYFIIATLYRNSDDSMFVKHLDWFDCKDSKETDLEFPYDYCLVKTKYSVWNEQKFIDFVKNKFGSLDVEYFLMGCETDCGIMATAFNFWDDNKNFKILSDYVYTNNSEISNDEILNLLERNFWDCVL